MQFEQVTAHVEKRLDKQQSAREEFDVFFKRWIEKHGLPKEAYRSISYLMSSYVSEYIE
jgi:hypothetical protein